MLLSPLPPTPNFILLFPKVKLLSHVGLFEIPWTVVYQAPPSMGFSRQECWSGLPFPSPGDLPYPGAEPILLNCRQTLYHLSHQGSPFISKQILNLGEKSLPASRLPILSHPARLMSSWLSQPTTTQLSSIFSCSTSFHITVQFPRRQKF